jgi:hypothetical protein
MKHQQARAEYDKLLTKVRTALLTDWDPIGVRDVPTAQDEYDTYAPVLCGLLMRGHSREDLIKHISWIVHDQMGLQDMPAENERFADRLLQISSDTQTSIASS